MIYSITPFSLLDYPGELSCIVWMASCNMRCTYCYNPEIVTGKGSLRESDLWAFLDKRKGLLDAVVLSGGECTNAKNIIPICQEIKRRGFLVKIDTNGSRPDVLQELIDQELIDYCALDFKAPEPKYQAVTRLSRGYELFLQSFRLLNESFIPFEVRTTVHADLLNAQDISVMASTLQKEGYSNIYYLQEFCDTKENLGQIGKPEKRFDPKKIYAEIPIDLRGFA